MDILTPYAHSHTLCIFSHPVHLRHPCVREVREARVSKKSHMFYCKFHVCIFPHPMYILTPYVYSHTLCIFSHPMYILTPYAPATLLGAKTLPTTALLHVGTRVCSRSESQKVLGILLYSHVYSHILSWHRCM